MKIRVFSLECIKKRSADFPISLVLRSGIAKHLVYRQAIRQKVHVLIGHEALFAFLFSYTKFGEFERREQEQKLYVIL